MGGGTLTDGLTLVIDGAGAPHERNRYSVVEGEGSPRLLNMIMSKIRTRITLSNALPLVAFAMCAGVPIAVMSALASFSLPNGDDFCRGRLLQLAGAGTGRYASPNIWSYVAESWRLWTGRWLGMAVETAVLSHVDFASHYPVLVIGLWAVLLLSLPVVAHQILGESGSRRLAIGSALLLWGVYWSGMPGTGDGFYWFTGAVEALLPIALGAVVVVFAARSASSTGGARGAFLAAAILGSAAVPGLHEVLGLALVAALIVGVIVAWPHGVRTSVPWLVCAVVALLGSMLVMSAPGNAVRAAALPPRNLQLALRIASTELWKAIPTWILGVPFLSASALFVLHPSMRAVQPAWVRRFFSGWRVWLAPFATAGIVAVGFFGPSFALSSGPPTRTQDGVYLVFLLGWFFSLFILGRAKIETSPQVSTPGWMVTAPLVVLACALVLQGNTRLALSDLRHSARDWNGSLHARYRDLRSARAQDTLVIARAASPPLSFVTYDIMESPAAWRNQCLAGYFGVAAVRLAPAATKQR